MDADDFGGWDEPPAQSSGDNYKPRNGFDGGRGGRGGRGRGGGRGGFRDRNDGDSGGWGGKSEGSGWGGKSEGGGDGGWNDSEGGDGGFRGERRGRGRGGGRGGSRGYNDNFSNGGDGGGSSWESSGGGGGGWDGGNKFEDGGDRPRGRGRGGGRGGRGGFRNDDGESGGGGWGSGGGGGDSWGNSGGGDNEFGGDDFGGGRGRGGRGRGRGGRGGGGDRGFGGDGGGQEAGGEDEKPKERYIPPEPTDDENTLFGTNISSGINFDKYDSIQVKVSGENVPQAITSFEDCQLRKLLLDNVTKSGYTKPTPVQKNAIPIISSGRDLMACAQTGSGKTAAFLLPIINKLLETSAEAAGGRTVFPQAVICTPTRELSIQIFHEARKFANGSCLKICNAYGGTVAGHQAGILRRGCNILVATPGRLNDFVSRENVSFSQIQFFVLDEADRMLDMGFLPAIEQMLDHPSMIRSGERQTLMFSATFPQEIQKLAANYLHNYLFLAVGIVGGACADVEQIIYEVPKFEKRNKLVEVMTNTSASDKQLTVVFVEQKRTADFIAAFLCENDFPTTSIHGDRLQSQREIALSDFKTGQRPILVATAVAARGLDIKNVAHVVNYDLPKSVDEYVHRIGRTGRLGNRGKATSFFDPNEDAQIASSLIRILEQAGQEVPTFLQNSGGGSGGGFSFADQEFGAHDVRGSSSSFKSTPSGAPCPVEEEESW